MRPASDEGHVVARAGKFRAVVPADGSRTQDRELHRAVKVTATVAWLDRCMLESTGLRSRRLVQIAVLGGPMAARLTAYLVVGIVAATLIAGLIVGAQRDDNDGPIDIIVHNAKIYTAGAGRDDGGGRRHPRQPGASRRQRA